jgi:O-antigen/teichoic acid export membrane protein
VLAAMTPFILLREFGRRHAFAHLRLPRAIAVDGTAAAVQMVGMVTLARAGWLGPASTFVLVGMGCGTVGLVWGARARHEFEFDRTQVMPQLRENLLFGRWIFASQVTSLINSYLVHWLLAFHQNVSATGLFAACSTLVMLSNPFIQGFSNVLIPWISRSYAEGQLTSLRRVVASATLVIGIVMGLFFAVIHVGGGQLLAILFGSNFVGHGATLSVLAAGTLVSTLSLAMQHGLWTMGVPQISFSASLGSLGMMLLTGLFLADRYGPLGAAWALSIGYFTGSVIIATAFIYHICQSDDDGKYD